ncbi:hypothetical protein [Pseudoduganella chitinolytica]|uniref:NnrS family protein n=1 Tax=Pseudoduganella chitinolytica TaxID=34070 RepID=A0ABY8BB02_9BURK|nr:hypothetical protein [Pseudoduganella chitinolytica]WEF33090.1 hypothetical protein PX653_27490 [Pseudoduganella chitinolytica]
MTSSPPPALTLYRWRMAYFLRQSAALYRRWGHVATVALALGGLVLVERPELLAGPLPHFRVAPAGWQASAVGASAWLALVLAWAGSHRDAVRGGPLAHFAASLPLAARTRALVDLGLLGAALAVFAVPFGAALLFAARAHDMDGADGRFLPYLVVLAVLTIAAARAAVFGWTGAARLLLPGGVAVLTGAPLLDSHWAAGVLLAATALAGCAVVLRPVSTVRPLGNGGTGRATGWLLLLRLQGALLWQHPHAVCVRLAMAALPLCGALWLVAVVGNVADAPVLVHLAAALAAGIMSGFFTQCVAGRAPLAAYLRALPSARFRLALAEHLLVLAGTALLFGAAWAVLAAAFGPATAPPATMLRAGLYWLAWLPLFGLPVIVRHRDGILFKIALAVPALTMALYS